MRCVTHRSHNRRLLCMRCVVWWVLVVCAGGCAGCTVIVYGERSYATKDWPMCVPADEATARKRYQAKLEAAAAAAKAKESADRKDRKDAKSYGAIVD